MHRHLISSLFMLLLCGLLSSSSLAQSSSYIQIPVYHHIEGSGDECYWDNGLLYVPDRKEDESIRIHYYSAETGQKVGTYSPPEDFRDAPGFAIEDGHIYFHTDDYITKVQMKTNRIVWEAEYSAYYAAQIEPFLYEKHVGIAVDDKIFIVDKQTGKPYISIDGEDFSQDMALHDGLLMYSKDEGETMMYDPEKKRVLWKKKVEDTGMGFLVEGDRVYLPTGEVRLYCLDRNTGREIWTFKRDDLKMSCGSGFNLPPLLIGNDLYAVQRESGLYQFDKRTGNLKSQLEIGEDVTWEMFEYKGHLIICGQEHLFAFNLQNQELKELATYPETQAFPDVILAGNKLCLSLIGFYDLPPKAWIFDLDQLLD